MQVDPLNETYGPIVDVPNITDEDEAREEQKKFRQALADGKVLAASYDREQLRKLQDDLRKRGYRRLR